MEVIDNFLPEKDWHQMKRLFFNGYIPWKFNTTVTGSEDAIDAFQFVHVMFHTKPQYVANHLTNGDPKAIIPILKVLNPSYLLRIKANLRTITDKPVQSDYHIDLDNCENIPYKTAIYYLNSNNGYTLFENGYKVPSVENRMLIFDGNTKHCGVSCTDQQSRVVLNINYI